MARTMTFKGNPMALEGSEVKVGQKAPDATLRSDLTTDYKISQGSGKKRIISVVPSVDTGVCAAQTKRFNDEMNKLEDVQFYTVSVDLPFAQGRFCGAEGIDKAKMTMLSDAKSKEFGKAWGTLIPEFGLNCRAVFVIGADDVVKSAEYVPEMTDHPNYDAALAAAKSL